MGPRLTVSALGGYFCCQLEERVSCECHAQPENNKTKRGESSLLHSSHSSVTPLWEEKWREWWWRRIVKWPDLTSYLSSRHGEWRVVSQDRDRGPLTTASTSNRQQERTPSHQLLTLDITTLSRTDHGDNEQREASNRELRGEVKMCLIQLSLDPNVTKQGWRGIVLIESSCVVVLWGSWARILIIDLIESYQ